MSKGDIIERKICPDPDGVCMQGGCGYCQLYRYKPLHTIQRIAIRKKLMPDYQWGFEHDFANAPVRRET